MSIISQIESILFVASQPLKIKRVSKAVGKNEGEVEEAIETLRMKYNRDDSGIHILISGDMIRMGANPEHSEVIKGFVKQEVTDELTKAQLETLTVIAYQAPVTRPELEQIRGVNCAVILRNLMVRGLITDREDKNKLLPVYEVSVKALAHLGIKSINELPNYETLSQHENVQLALEE